MPPTYGTTPVSALRYLLGSNLIRDVDAGFQALAEDVDAKMGMTKIAEANGATQSFTAIAASWRHLKLIGSARSTSGSGGNLLLRLNNASGAGTYEWVRVQDDATSTTRSGGSGAAITSIDLGIMPDSGQTALLDFEIDIINYREVAHTGIKATLVGHTPGGGALLYDVAGRYVGSTAVIDRVDLLASTAALATISRCCLYGVL